MTEDGTREPVVKWTDEEIAILRELHLKLGMMPMEIFRSGKLPGRTKHSIAQQSFKLRKTGIEQISFSAQIKKQAEILIAAIPEDTRSKAARLMGDPIPNDPRRAATKPQADNIVQFRRAS